MKKIISLITMAAMLAVSTPAVANGRHNDNRWGVDSNRNSPYHGRHHRNNNRNNNRINTGEAVAIGIGALILGAAIANNNRNDDDHHGDDVLTYCLQYPPSTTQLVSCRERQPPRPQRGCASEHLRAGPACLLVSPRPSARA